MNCYCVRMIVLSWVRCMGSFLRRLGNKMCGKGPIALSHSFIPP